MSKESSTSSTIIPNIMMETMIHPRPGFSSNESGNKEYMGGESSKREPPLQEYHDRAHDHGQNAFGMPLDMDSILNLIQEQATSHDHITPTCDKNQQQLSGHDLSKDKDLQQAVMPVKRRGRKRTHPEMSEEERRQFRIIRNRQSAKKSRNEMKNIKKDFSIKIESMIRENQSLKDQIEDMRKRLNFLKSIVPEDKDTSNFNFN